MVEIGEREAGLLEVEREAELRRRDLVVERLNEGATFYKGKDGKMYTKEQNKSASQCPGHVADALENGGVNLRKHQDKNDPNYFRAYKYREYLEKENFIPIKNYIHNKKDIDSKRIYIPDPENYNPQKGDVVVFDVTIKHDDGHMAMYNGKIWVSDFVQRYMWGGGIRKEAPSYKIYRNPRWQEF